MGLFDDDAMIKRGEKLLIDLRGDGIEQPWDEYLGRHALGAGQAKRLAGDAGHAAPRDQADGGRFLRAISIVLGSAGLLAIVWGTLPVLMLPSCSGATV